MYEIEFLRRVAEEGLASLSSIPVVLTLLAGFSFTASVSVFVSSSEKDDGSEIAALLFFMSSALLFFSTLYCFSSLSFLKTISLESTGQYSANDLRDKAEYFIIHSLVTFIFGGLSLLGAMCIPASKKSKHGGGAVCVVSALIVVGFIYYLTQDPFS